MQQATVIRPVNRRSKLHDKCVELIRNRPKHLTLGELGKALNISDAYLSDMTCGRVKAANAAYLERIYTYFTGKEIQL